MIWIVFLKNFHDICGIQFIVIKKNVDLFWDHQRCCKLPHVYTAIPPLPTPRSSALCYLRPLDARQTSLITPPSRTPPSSPFQTLSALSLFYYICLRNPPLAIELLTLRFLISGLSRHIRLFSSPSSCLFISKSSHLFYNPSAFLWVLFLVSKVFNASFYNTIIIHFATVEIIILTTMTS